MNPDQIAALLQDLMSRSTEAVKRGNQDAADIYEVSARVVREHAALAASAKQSRRADALGLSESVRCPL